MYHHTIFVGLREKIDEVRTFITFITYKVDDVDAYFIDNSSIFEPAYGYGGGNAFQTVRGTEVWLNNKAQTSSVIRLSHHR